jgi:hypothetical protein
MPNDIKSSGFDEFKNEWDGSAAAQEEYQASIRAISRYTNSQLSDKLFEMLTYPMRDNLTLADIINMSGSKREVKRPEDLYYVAIDLHRMPKRWKGKSCVYKFGEKISFSVFDNGELCSGLGYFCKTYAKALIKNTGIRNIVVVDDCSDDASAVLNISDDLSMYNINSSNISIGVEEARRRLVSNYQIDGKIPFERDRMSWLVENCKELKGNIIKLDKNNSSIVRVNCCRSGLIYNTDITLRFTKSMYIKDWESPAYWKKYADIAVLAAFSSAGWWHTPTLPLPLILKILYDDKIKPGSKQDDVRDVIRDIVAHISF